jgi:ABC-2 type transport system permease protein
MRVFSYALPPSYVFEGLRAVVSGGVVSMRGLAAGGCLAVIYILLACRIFTWVYRKAVRSGLIARYSAESVS